MKTGKLVADGICSAVILLFIAKMFITQCSDTSLYCC
jgi:hypothetical protein